VHISFDQQPNVHSESSHTKVQHRDKDASEWVPPAASLSLLWATRSVECPAPTDKIHFRFQYGSLYNRPPPVA
jgi:hypothetical protein